MRVFGGGSTGWPLVETDRWSDKGKTAVEKKKIK